MKRKTNAHSKFKQSELNQSFPPVTYSELQVQASITNDVTTCSASGAMILDNLSHKLSKINLNMN
jgi:hypothetical protein